VREARRWRSDADARDQANTAMTTSTSTPNAIHCPKLVSAIGAKTSTRPVPWRSPSARTRTAMIEIRPIVTPFHHPRGLVGLLRTGGRRFVYRLLVRIAVHRPFAVFVVRHITDSVTVTGRADGNRLHLQTQGVTENLVQGPSKTSSRMCFETYLETSRFEAPQRTPISPKPLGQIRIRHEVCP